MEITVNKPLAETFGWLQAGAKRIDLQDKIQSINYVLGPGESGYALIMFTEMLTARNLDKFIIRFFSPMVTVGGGQILDMQSRRLRRADDEVMTRLNRLAGTPEERIDQLMAVAVQVNEEAGKEA